MSAAVKVIENEIVPICLVIETGDATKFPKSIIYNEAGSQIGTRDLSHVANGVYLPDVNYFMPSNDFIKVVYIVFTDAARTIPDEDLGQDLDTFLKETVHQLVWDEPIINHTIAGSTGETLSILQILDLDALLSRLIPCDIIVNVDSDEAQSVIINLNSEEIAVIDEENALVALVDIEGTINTNMETQEIIGVINEC